MKYKHLFSPGRIGKMEIKNRLIMPPMVRNYADANGRVTERYLDHISRVAQGGVGAITLEASYVSLEGKGFVNELGIHADDVIPGLRQLADIAHRHGVKIGTQLYHAGRQTSSKTSGFQPVAPSPLPDPTVNEIPRELTVQEIQTLITAYALAAGRCKTAGLDYVELHGAHGYLIMQFLSPYSNRRKDKYGGTPAKRMNFLLEVYGAVRHEVGRDFPIIVRLSGDEGVPGGLTIKDTKAIAKVLESAGADALHISAGNYASYAQGKMISPMAIPDGPLVPVAAAVKKAVSIPVIAVNKLRTAKLGESILKSKQADFIGIGRTLLADPDWPNKVLEDRENEISRCIACNQGCISRLFEQKDVWCTVNPETGRERMFAKGIKRKKHVVVVGGGPAGMEAARVAAEKGHRVTLFEERAILGGQLIAAAEAPHRQGWEELRQDLTDTLDRLDVDIRLNTTFTTPDAKKMKPDAVIVAIGSSARIPSIPGIGRTNVVTARDLLEQESEAKGKVVIAGGGCMGAQTAEYLAAKGHPVTVIEAGQAIAQEAPVDDRQLLLGRLDKLGVKILRETKMMAIGPNAVMVESHQGPKKLAADTVVVCIGSISNDGFIHELKEIIKEVYVVGDALEPRRVTDAIAEGALAALNL